MWGREGSWQGGHEDLSEVAHHSGVSPPEHQRPPRDLIPNARVWGPEVPFHVAFSSWESGIGLEAPPAALRMWVSWGGGGEAGSRS